MLEIPEHASVVEYPAFRLWREESGIVCVISKKVTVRAEEVVSASIGSLRRMLGNEKVCMLIDVTQASETSPAVRTLAAEELPHMVKAIAVVSASALGKMVATLFFNLKSQPYPVKIFNNEGEARAWLKKFL